MDTERPPVRRMLSASRAPHCTQLIFSNRMPSQRAVGQLEAVRGDASASSALKAVERSPELVEGERPFMPFDKLRANGLF